MHIDQLNTQDVQDWLDKLPTLCQCCLQAKDAGRPDGKQRCCAIGFCCQLHASRRTIQAARNTLQAALSHAITSNVLTSRNVAALARVPTGTRPQRRRKNPPWSPAQASRFLTSARRDDDPLHAAYVLVIVNAMTKGEVLGLTWPSIDLDRAEITANWQLQRVGTELIHRQRIKTRESDADDRLPLPGISVAALKLRRAQQDAAREEAGDRWQPSDLVFTTRREDHDP